MEGRHRSGHREAKGRRGAEDSRKQSGLWGCCSCRTLFGLSKKHVIRAKCGEVEKEGNRAGCSASSKKL